MGFCRHCGDIVTGSRCSTCGGAAVAPAVSFKKDGSFGHQDKWLKTYSSSERSVSPVRNLDNGPPGPKEPQSITPASSVITTAISTKRFPLPKSKTITTAFALTSGVSEHIASATSVSSPRPPSPLKLSTTLSDTENDILPSFSQYEPSLSKVYGSVLQPKDTLTLHSCAICEAIFAPDATIYPNPTSSQSSKRSFLCKICFTDNGGSKGNCPACSRPVLALRNEGAYIQSGGNFWHKQCYNCAGCFKNIGDAPMADLLGRPSCVDCFDNCLKRDHPTTPKKNRAVSKTNSPSFSNPGGLNSSYGPGKPSRESSPALEELEQRLGLFKSLESSPRLFETIRAIPPTSSNNSPLRHRSVTPQTYGQDPILNQSRQNTPTKAFVNKEVDMSSATSPPTAGQMLSIDDVFRSSRSTMPPPRSPSSSLSDHSHSLTASAPKPLNKNNDSSIANNSIVNQTNVPFAASSLCKQCGKITGGQFVTIPGVDENAVPQTFHSECFKCAICDKSFSDARKVSASFVITHRGPCHIQCTPSEPVVPQKPKILNGIPDWAPTIPQDLPTWTSKKLNFTMSPESIELATSPRAISPSKLASPRFGGQTSCPGCHKAVSSMERGVVPGPQGSRWHASCLVCGGKKETTRAVLLGRVRDDTKKVEPGCGKKLDSAAKIDGEGGIWCRECLLFAGVGGSPQASPTKSPTSSICIPGKINPQITGTTTLSRQFTGIGTYDPILRQLTGSGLSPTRSISPTKQLGLMGGGRPRPKSVIGSVRHTKTQSIDEGRGMYLVRQMTGTASPGGWGER